MSKYSLLLISENKPDTPAEIRHSNGMIAYGLWQEFSKMKHVDLHYYDCDIKGDYAKWSKELRELPIYDFVLVHSYCPGYVFYDVPFLRQRGSHMMWISENTFEGWLSKDVFVEFDHNFTFLPDWECRKVKSQEQIHLPCLKDVIDGTRSTEKYRQPGSVLLDHAYDPNIYPEPGYLWCERLYNWLDRSGRAVGQLERIEHEQKANLVIPEWVHKIPNSRYLDYLHNTSAYENFVVTHPGSYEHSVIDMVGRGIRVLVPRYNGQTFIPRDTVDRLELPTFSNMDEFFYQLNVPHDGRDNKSNRCMGMPEIAAQVDRYCQRIINGRK